MFFHNDLPYLHYRADVEHVDVCPPGPWRFEHCRSEGRRRQVTIGVACGSSPVHGLGGDCLEPSFRAGRRKAPKAEAFGCRRRNHRWAGSGLGRRQSHPLSQRLHSTLVVAGVEILRRASAHKRSPLFRRWAPALSTVRPERSPGSSSTGRGKMPGDLSGERKKVSRRSAIADCRSGGLRAGRRIAGGAHTSQKDERAGFLAGARHAYRPESIPEGGGGRRYCSGFLD